MKKSLFLLVIGLLCQPVFAQEKIVNEGAVTIDTASSPSPNPGTIEYRSGEFRGFDGANWHKLDNPAYAPPPPSFAYAWLKDSSGIPVNTWTKIHFDRVEFDHNGEFKPFNAVYSEGSFFPNEPGFYQVTARCEYEVIDHEPGEESGDTISTHLYPGAYVSIAVFTGIPNQENPSPQDDIMYSQGNNLQIEVELNEYGAMDNHLNRNNAPNVSTIVEVHPGQSISIYGFWYKPFGLPGTGHMPFQVAHDPGVYADESPLPETGGPPPSRPDKSKVYVTIHRVFP
jgi:hypothetical protein